MTARELQAQLDLLTPYRDSCLGDRREWLSGAIYTLLWLLKDPRAMASPMQVAQKTEQKP